MICTECEENIGSGRVTARGTSEHGRLWWTVFNRCPHCGVETNKRYYGPQRMQEEGTK